MDGLGQMQRQRVTRLVGPSGLFPIVAEATKRRLMLTHSILAELREQVLECLVAESAHAVSRQLHLPALVVDQARVLEALDHLSEALELGSRVVAEVASQCVDVDLIERRC